MKPTLDFRDPTGGPLFTVRFIIALVLMVLGLAVVVFYYVAVRPDPEVLPLDPGSPAFMADLARWNYVIGFGLFFLGLAASAHPSTPLGRGRGVVVGMLGCFVLGLIWICVYYVFSNQSDVGGIPVLNDLGQYNLLLGIAFMGVGFTFATRWE